MQFFLAPGPLVRVGVSRRYFPYFTEKAVMGIYEESMQANQKYVEKFTLVRTGKLKEIPEQAAEHRAASLSS